MFNQIFNCCACLQCPMHGQCDANPSAYCLYAFLIPWSCQRRVQQAMRSCIIMDPPHLLHKQFSSASIHKLQRSNRSNPEISGCVYHFGAAGLTHAIGFEESAFAGPRLRAAVVWPACLALRMRRWLSKTGRTSRHLTLRPAVQKETTS